MLSNSQSASAVASALMGHANGFCQLGFRFADREFHARLRYEATQVGLNLQIKLHVSRVLKTHLNLTVLVDQPETMAEIPSGSGQIKLDDRAARRHFGCIQPHM